MNLNNVYMTDITEYNSNKPFPHRIIENFLDINMPITCIILYYL